MLTFARLAFVLLICGLGLRITSAQTHDRPTFEDEKIRLAIPQGWSLQAATVQVTGDHPAYKMPIGALLTKGQYKLFLLTNYTHASGVEGGRFAEVVDYVSPWIEMSDSPSLPCIDKIQSVRTIVDSKLARIDLYLDTAHANRETLEQCGNPDIKATLWYGSYFVERCSRTVAPLECGGPFLLHGDFGRNVEQSKDGWKIPPEQDEMLFTVTYDTKTAKSLPTKQDARLQWVLREADRIVTSIHYK